MSPTANKISTILDIDDRGFKGSLKSIGTAVGEADGFFGKFKAGATGAMDSVKANTGAFALAAGASLVAFGIKAVGAFTETAKAALDLSTSTGLAVEDASRWVAVGDDFEVGSDALATGLGKIAKTLDDTKWTKYGIATRDAGGQARDTNDILLDSFDMLSKVNNKTEQARIGQALFGKGYQSLTPILGHTREEYEKMLGSVERGQVITDQEAKKAERFRLAQDQLGDALKDVTIAVGQQVAALAPYLEILAKIVIGIQGTEVHRAAVDLFESLAPLNDEIRKGGHDIEYWADQIATGKMTLEQATKAIHDATVGTAELAISQRDQAAATAETERETRKLPIAWEETRDAEEQATEAARIYKQNADATARSVKQNIDEMIGKWDELTGSVEDDKAWLTLQGTFDAVRQKAVDAFTAAAEHADDAEQKGRDYQISIDDLILSVVGYGKTVADLPPEKVTLIKAAIDQGDIDRAEAMLAILTRNRNVSLDIIARGGAGYGVGAQASGGQIPRSQRLTLVGERGPELISAPGARVYNAGDTVSMLGGPSAGSGPSIVLHVHGSVISERDLVKTVVNGIIDGQRRGEILPWSA